MGVCRMSLLMSLSGFPGYGKTTQCKLLQKYYAEKTVVLSVPMILRMDMSIKKYLSSEDIKTIGCNMEGAKLSMKKGILVNKYADELLYKVTEKVLKKNRFVILDGSPRDTYSLELFDKLCRKSIVNQGVIIRLVSSYSDDIEMSIARQKYREEYEGRDICITQLANKSKVYFKYINESLLQYIQKDGSNVQYYEINCDNKIEEVQKQIRGFIESIEIDSIRNS